MSLKLKVPGKNTVFFIQGYGVEDIFEAVIDKIPPPNKHNSLSSLRFFLQDSWYDMYRGTVVSIVFKKKKKN